MSEWVSRDDILRCCAAGSISPQIALARLLIAGEHPDPVHLRSVVADAAGASALQALAALVERHSEKLAPLRELAQLGFMPEGDNVMVQTGRLFDRLASTAPEAGVAFYSFGDSDALAQATEELLGVVRSWVMLAGRRVLDFGCGIGRLSIPLAEEAAEVLGVDLSSGMVEQAQQRAGARSNLRFLTSNGKLPLPLDTASVEVMIAADSLPYVVQAGALTPFLAEAARLLTDGGDLLVFNWSYRGDLERDIREARMAASEHGLSLLRAGEHPFRIWDAAGFHLRRVR